MELNEFADLTQEEFKAMYTGNLPRLDESHFVGTFESSGVKDLPESLDWRDQDGVMTPVKNQGACGSCWAFSAVETLESHLAIATGEPAPHLSPQQVVACSPNPDHCGGTGGCQGSTQPLAFNYTQTVGLSTEADYPYTGYSYGCQEAKIKPCAQNDGYVQVKVNDYASHMEALQKGPVSISLAAMSLQLYGGGVLSYCDCDMDHAVQLVGYGTTGTKDYWLVRNSWGGSWGERGYVRIQRFGAQGEEPTCVDKTPQDGEACAGDTEPRTYAGLCGLLGSSSYPTGMKKVGDCPAPPAGCQDFGVNTCLDCPDYCGEHGGQKGCSSGTFGLHCNCADGFGCSGVSASTVV
jgi:cathepsin L